MFAVHFSAIKINLYRVELSEQEHNGRDNDFISRGRTFAFSIGLRVGSFANVLVSPLSLVGAVSDGRSFLPNLINVGGRPFSNSRLMTATSEPDFRPLLPDFLFLHDSVSFCRFKMGASSSSSALSSSTIFGFPGIL